MGLNLFVLGLVYIVVGMVYLFGVIVPGNFTPTNMLNLWLRPNNLLLILVPFLIIKRLKL